MFYRNNHGGRSQAVFFSYPRVDPGLLTDSVGLEDVLSESTKLIATTDTAGSQDTPLSVLCVEQSDSLGLRDTPVGIAVHIATSADSLGTQDTSSFGIKVVFTESVGPQDTSTPLGARIVVFADSVGTQDTPSALTVAIGVLADSSGLRDTISATLAVGSTPGPVPTVPTNLAWSLVSANADSGAFADYTFSFEPTGVGAHRGTLYVTTDSGLYALDSTTDNGSAVAWELRTGFDALGSELLKRIIGANVLGRGGASFSLILVSNLDDEKHEEIYPSPVTLGGDSSGRVVKAGRGFSSTHWQIGVSGTGMARINGIVPEVEMLSRRR